MDIWQHFGITTDAFAFTTNEAVSEVPADILHVIEQTLKSEFRESYPSQIYKTVALVRYEDFFEFEKPLAFGEYFYENDQRQAMIALNDVFVDEVLYPAVFWHEYAHHLYNQWYLAESVKMADFMEKTKVTSTWAYLEELNRREGTTYWTDEEEVWARAASQLFLILAGEKEALEAIAIQMPHWNSKEFPLIARATFEVLRDSAFFTFAQEDFAPNA